MKQSEWKYDNEAVNFLVDSMLNTLNESGAPPVTREAMSFPFRAYMQWIHSAQCLRVPAADVRGTMLAFISSMLMEACRRMGEIDDEGNKVSMEVWLGEFMIDLKEELIADVEYLKTVGTGRRPTGH